MRRRRHTLLYPPQVRARDGFADADGTVLANHIASDGGTWTKHPSAQPGDLLINANRIHNPDTTELQLYYHSWLPANPDYDVECDVVLVSDNNTSTASVTGRINPASGLNFYLLQYTSASNEWVLFKRTAGIATIFARVVQVLTPGQVYRARLSMRGSTIKAYVDGLEILSATDTDHTAAGRAGLQTQLAATPTTGVHFDAWRVRQ